MSKGAPSSTAQISRVLRNPNAWLIIAMLVIAATLHYGCHIQLIEVLSGQPCPPGITRHAMDRIILLLPITYAGFVFGPVIGFATLLIAAVIMFPRAIFISLEPRDALFETAAVLVTGSLIILWFDSQEREKRQRADAVAKLEAAHRELQSSVQIIKNDERRLSALNAISFVISQSLELETVLEDALDEILRVVQADMAMVFMVDEGSQELVLSAQRGVAKEYGEGGLRIGLDEGLNGKVVRSGERIVTEDVDQDPRLSDMAAGQMTALTIVPLQFKNKVLGTLCVATTASRHFLPEEIELLAQIANHIGVAAENARLYQQGQMVADRLRVSEQNYRQLFETANDAIWVQDMDGRIVAANKASARLIGGSQEELIGFNVSDFLLPEGLEVAREVKRKLLQGEEFEQPYEQQLVKKNGTVGTIKLTSSLVTRNGHSLGFQHIARDITEEKKMQENLRFYAQQITKAQEEERKRIARELHDDTAQALVTMARQLDILTDDNESLSRDAVKDLERLRSQVDNILEGVRRFSRDLRPSMLDDLGLVPALESIADDITSQHGIVTEVEVFGEHRHLPSEKELLLFRVAQEALRNVWKHSQASQAWITLEFSQDKIKITVRDNGVGFHVPDRVGDLLVTGKLGLAGMYERAQLVGGSMTVESKPGKGTTITAIVPA